MTDETVAALEAVDEDGHEHSYGEYQQRKKRDLPSCDGCREAAAEYHRQYRRRNPEVAARERAKMGAYNRALRRLARLHQTEFRLLLAEERAKIGH